MARKPALILSPRPDQSKDRNTEYGSMTAEEIAVPPVGEQAQQKVISKASLSGVQKMKVVLSRTYIEDFDILLAHNNVLDFVRTVPSETVRLVVTSPPYNIGKPYESRREFREYLDWQKEVLLECVRVLMPGVSICWQVGNYIEEGEVYPLDIFFYNLLKSTACLKLRNRIIWTFEHGLHASKRLSGRYETILWFTKGDDYVFNLDSIRIPQKYPGKTYYKGPKRGLPSGNPLGKNPGDIWRVIVSDWESEIWDIPNVKSNHPEKTIHPAQFPIELVERLVLALTNAKDLVFDPFMGVGSAVISALLHDRRGMGVDKEGLYVDIAYRRAKEAVQGTLKRRPLGKRKYEPTGHDKISKTPAEWKNESD